MESRVLGFRIQLKESRIPLTIRIQNPESTDKHCNPVPGIRNPRRGIHSKAVLDSFRDRSLFITWGGGGGGGGGRRILEGIT